MESGGEVKKATLDSLSRIPCTPEEMYSARSEKKVHRSGDIHATSREGDFKSTKLSCHSSILRQDKKGHAEVFGESSVQRFSQEKAEYRHKSRGCSVSDVQAFQMDGHSGDSSLLLQFQNPKEHMGNCLRQQSLFSQQADREKEDNRDRHIGPGFIGPSKSKELTSSLQGVKAHSSQDFPVQEETTTIVSDGLIYVTHE
ncbi:hypothetical protein Ancab_031097 [Ancistrocladus abbreviatus]